MPDRRRAAADCSSIEATGHIGPPKRYLSVRGQFLEHSPYCERDLRGPAEPLLVDGEDVEVLVQHRRGWTRHVYAHHPFDVVGWDGCLYPWAFSIHDFEPITGRVHQPPPVHQTFEGPNFVICSFVPAQGRLPPAGDPGAVQPPQRRLRRDAVLHRRQLRGPARLRHRAGLDLAAPVRLHPRPAAGRGRAGDRRDYFDELAVMVDTFRPLDLCEPALACEDTGYAWTWAGRRAT